MSWDGWVELMKSEAFAYGGIFSLEGDKWGDFTNEATLSIDACNIKNAAKCASDGPGAAPVFVGDKKVMVFRAGDGEMCAKGGSKCCVVAVKCTQCIVLGVGGPESEPRALRCKLDHLVDSLKEKGY